MFVIGLEFCISNNYYVQSGNVNVNEIKDTLCLHIFDECVTDLSEDDRSRDSEIYQRRWIGELRIPFSTIYSTQRVS